MAKLVSKTYGDALFELAVEENKTGLFLEEVTGLLQIIRENSDLKLFMGHPKITKEEKIQMIEQVFGDRVEKEIVGFLLTIIEKDRYPEVEAILEYVIAQIKEYDSIGTAYVTTAVPITQEEAKDIETKLLATTKYRKMECVYETDAALIGGMVIRIGDHVVDSSIRTKMDKLERELLAVQI